VVVIFALVSGVLPAPFGALHRYVWRRLIRHTAPKGSLLRRAGNVVFTAGPLLSMGAITAEGENVPFLVQRILAWPGYLCMALFLYLLLALVAGETVRPVLRRWLARRGAGAGLRQRARPAPQPAQAQAGDGGAEELGAADDLGLSPLENARVELPRFDLADVNDVQDEAEGQGPDFDRALGDRDRSRAAVLLAHQPVVIRDAVGHGVDLQLSGHTHGGQLWPGSLLAEPANPTVAGLERYGDTQLYVSRSAGA
jgi:hypothetical protein